MYDDLVKELRNLLRAYKATDNENCHQAKILAEAADAIEDLSKENESLGKDLTSAVEMLKKKRKPKWIPVTERLPENYERVLTCDDHENIHIMSHSKGYEYPFGIKPEHPRYFMPKWWMPLPEPPEPPEKESES